jgi:uncharacterized protein YigA (DUF484 family)
MKVNQATNLPGQGAIHDAAVADYLRNTPDFFTRHSGLLTELRVPHASGRAVSLVERQVELLRAELASHRKQIQTLLGLAAERERLNARLHRLTLALIDAADFNEVLNTLEDHLHEQFRADAVELRLLSEIDMAADEAVREVFRRLFEDGRPLCGPLQPGQMTLLFGAQAQDLRSAALLPLRGEGIRGILAIGSADAERFHPDMGTDFLARLGEIVSLKLQVVSLPGV